jgi:cytochrome c-type biogenesis protein
MKYSVKAGAALMIFMGVLMFTGRLNSISTYLSQFTGAQVIASDSVQEESDVSESDLLQEDDVESLPAESGQATEQEDTDVAEDAASSEQQEAEEASEQELIPAPDFTLTDQYGVTHSLADYRGKVIFLNFWATWCPPCRAEMPDIQALYEEYAEQEDPEVVILGVAFPDSGKEQDVEGVKAFLDENGYTYPVLMDEGATLQLPYYVTAYPTTFLIDEEGYVLGYIPGMMTKDIMRDVISQALNR